MTGTIAVLTTLNPTRRQVARALYSGGLELRFLERVQDLKEQLEEARPSLLILDVESLEPDSIASGLELLSKVGERVPVIMLSLGENKGALVSLLNRYDVGNLVAKHGAIRAVYPVLDERELLVTCRKVLSREIFGIEKYIGSWGVAVTRATLTSMADKYRMVEQFEGFLTDLECPPAVVPEVVTVADELMLNAIIHAPRDQEGRPKYEHLEPDPSLVLEPSEYVEVAYACDGQRMMFSVSDRFGFLARQTIQNYLSKSFASRLQDVEQKPSGAGLGLSMAFRRIHQMVFNIHESVRTEVIAGWYLRVQSASEFRQVSKSVNVFWLSRDQGSQTDSPVDHTRSGITSPSFERPEITRTEVSFDIPERAQAFVSEDGPKKTIHLSGRIDERARFPDDLETSAVDMRGVTGFTSNGVIAWLRFIQGLEGRRLDLIACPESLVRLSSEVDGMLGNLRVRTVMAPFECVPCGHTLLLELVPSEVLPGTPHTCNSCSKALQFSGLTWEYESLLQMGETAS